MQRQDGGSHMENVNNDEFYLKHTKMYKPYIMYKFKKFANVSGSMLVPIREATRSFFREKTYFLSENSDFCFKKLNFG